MMASHNVSLPSFQMPDFLQSFLEILVGIGLLFAGGEGIRGFAAALTIGVVVGTYSSIFVAANVLLLLNIQREDLLVPEKESREEEMP